MYYKGLILEVKNTTAFVLRDDGSVIKIKGKNGMNVGECIYYLDEDIIPTKEKSSKIKHYLTPLMAVALLMFVFISPIFKGDNKILAGYAIVTLDINPSISIEIDKNQIITDIKGLNDDGANLSLEKIKGIPLNKGIIKLKELINNSTSTNKSQVIIGFTFLDDIIDDDFEGEVKNIVNSSFNNYLVEYFKGTPEALEKSKTEGISLGKYEAMLQIDDDDILEDELKKLSVPQLIELLNKTSNNEMQEEIKDELEDKIDDENEKNNDDSIDDFEDTNDDSDDDSDSTSTQNINDSDDDTEDDSDDDSDVDSDDDN